MGQTLKEVIDLLYKPPPGARQAIAVSRRVAEQLPPLSTVAMISITAPERAPAEVHGFVQLLRLSFADVDFLNTEISARAKAKIKDGFTSQQAKDIHAFVQALAPAIRTVVVHCEGGYSRSSGVVLALHNVYGFAVNASSLNQANRSVVTTMEASKR
ncbi:MAG: hypothetical protein L0H10_08250 [Comamonas sp.]|uniref:hypothetical protein n=1 Tax=Comamonas sp. TaxID=34028 RepID=UPI002649C482|nr:hypothetical protein [Comamonas sp.]MDN5503799.1 hypothetical protein [Comamonas sp.]MDN5538690.1 hypothetical protein [Comamonas sp.]